MTMKRELAIILTVVFITWGLVLFFTADILTKEPITTTTTAYNIKYNVVIEGMHFDGSGGIGSGVVIAPGIVLTAGHCVAEVNEIWVTTYSGDKVKATGYYKDKKYDVGLIKIPTTQYGNAKLGDSNLLNKGDAITAIGNPLGIWDNTVIYGRVYTVHFIRKAVSRTDNEFILAKASVLPGNSGGGVYCNNKLIGIVVMGNGKDACIIVPINTVKEILNKEGIKYEAN